MHIWLTRYKLAILNQCALLLMIFSRCAVMYGLILKTAKTPFVVAIENSKMGVIEMLMKHNYKLRRGELVCTLAASDVYTFVTL